MLRRSPYTLKEKILERGGWKKLIGWATLAEASFLGLSYFGWNRLNKNIDTRYHFYQNYNWVLISFYKIGELMDSNYKAREQDIEIWRREGKL